MNAPSSLTGQVVVGRYRIVRQLGRGGMGAVYEAIQLSMNRPVAMKLIHPTLAEDEELVARFHREMQVTSSIVHPNTVSVLDFGATETGQLFLVMELLDGRSLAAVLRDEGALPLRRIVHIGKQVLRALAAAHHEGIVHRDLKPENVMLQDRFDERDAVKVLDFGIARVLEPGANAPAMTMEGTLLGTPGYMSPEQATGKPVGPASDLYSFGVLLYQMATGGLPYSGTTIQELLVKQVTEPPRPPSAIAPGKVAPQLEALILALLQKDPAARPSSAAAVQTRLEACLDPAPVPGLDPSFPAGPGGGTVILDGHTPTVNLPSASGGPAPTGTAVVAPQPSTRPKQSVATGPGRPSSATGPGRPGSVTGPSTGPKPAPHDDLEDEPAPSESDAAPAPVPARPRGGSPWPLVAGGVVVLLVAGGATLGWMTWTRQKQRAAAAAEARAKLDALLAASGEPAAPEVCRARAAEEVVPLLAAMPALAPADGAAPGDGALAALAELETVAAARPEAPEVWTLVARGRLYAKEDTAGALEAARTAARLCPNSAAAQHLRALAARDRGELEEAKASFQRAAAADASWAAPPKALGLLLLKERDFRGASAALGQALQRRPEDLGARLGRAQARFLSGDLEGAREDAQEATRASADRAEGWLLLGHVLAREKRFEEALTAFCEAKRRGSAEAAKLCTSD
ncbi:MAG TPA: protein kinase [Anaeromyxobacter sp.]|nr:protein kinase [Anaeromyxobacter sp.]